MSGESRLSFNIVRAPVSALQMGLDPDFDDRQQPQPDASRPIRSPFRQAWKIGSGQSLQQGDSEVQASSLACG